MQKTHNLHAFMLLVSECALAALKKLLIVIIYIFNKVVDLWRVTSLKKRLQYRCILIFEDIFFTENLLSLVSLFVLLPLFNNAAGLKT